MLSKLPKCTSILLAIFALACVQTFDLTVAEAQPEEDPLPDASLVEAETPPAPPNIVIIFVDDLGYGDIAAFGAPKIKTPHIDSIAANGAKYTQFYSASPVCTPSRAALLTGRYPIRMGIHEVFFPGSYTGMPETEITIAELLKTVGYNTAAVGKWHLGHRQQYLPLNQGFDEFFGIPYSNDMSPLPMMRGNEFIASNVDQTTLTRDLTEEAIRYIEAQAETPFFLFLAHPMPHVPLYRSEAFEGQSEGGVYGDVIEELDWSVGEILGALTENGHLDNTLVVFTSDNGPWIVMGDEGGSSGSLRNGKGTTFEGGIRVPLVAQLPGTIAPETVIEAPAMMLDWLPTIAALSGAEMPSDRAIDGQDLSPTWSDPDHSLPNRTLGFYSHGILEAVRVGDWKLKRPYDSSTMPIPGPIKWFLGGEIGLSSHGTMLFNLADDPSERKNLAKSQPQKLQELEDAADAFEASLQPLPPEITEVDLALSPAIHVMLGAVAKLLLIVLLIISLVVAALFYFLGHYRGRKKRPS